MVSQHVSTHAGHVDIQKTGEKTKTGADKETFGTGRAAQVRI
jgi:hypothetical protein